ncbi:hypothetical protein [Roseomonas sp. KE2513]|uniref:hypothetical protein n=1 Tax=Roseomonas sp. KE2513 TaxID=2479202 RepID=UPI0018E02B2F|nr:hypothetical protein [Roseomonas sp. KE2513]
MHRPAGERDLPFGIRVDDGNVQHGKPNQPELQEKGWVLGVGERPGAEEKEAGGRSKHKTAGGDPHQGSCERAQRAAAEQSKDAQVQDSDAAEEQSKCKNVSGVDQRVSDGRARESQCDRPGGQTLKKLEQGEPQLRMRSG